MAAAPPLLTLRDLLELACESSCSDGFRSYPRRLTWHGGADACVQAKADAEAAPVGLLIEADLRRSPSRTLSSMLFPRSPGSLATVSRLTRSLSRRLVFWRRPCGHDDDDGADERDSLGLPSPVVSSCSASECSEHAEAEAADVLLVEAEEQASDESEKPSPSTSSGCTGSADDGAADGDGHNKVSYLLLHQLLFVSLPLLGSRCVKCRFNHCSICRLARRKYTVEFGDRSLCPYRTCAMHIHFLSALHFPDQNSSRIETSPSLGNLCNICHFHLLLLCTKRK